MEHGQGVRRATGKLLWSYDPQVPRELGVKGCCDVVNRGVAAWNGKIYVGTFDGRLVALDARDRQAGVERGHRRPEQALTITEAPRVVKGRVIIGKSGGEYGIRGYISAYDAETGKLAWRFYTVPGDPSKPFENKAMAMAAKTWSGEWWKLGGGGTVWDAISYDPELNLVYFGVGNGIEWARKYRSASKGDNLFLSSIVALNADTGDYVWHYQATPGEEWDFDAVQQLILADLTIDGKRRKVLMQANKNGFFYVLDREDRQADLGEDLRSDQLGERRRPEDRPADREPRDSLQRDREAGPDDARARSARIAGSRWRSTRRPGSSTSRRRRSDRSSCRSRISNRRPWAGTSRVAAGSTPGRQGAPARLGSRAPEGSVARRVPRSVERRACSRRQATWSCKATPRATSTCTGPTRARSSGRCRRKAP